MTGIHLDETASHLAGFHRLTDIQTVLHAADVELAVLVRFLLGRRHRREQSAADRITQVRARFTILERFFLTCFDLDLFL